MHWGGQEYRTVLEHLWLNRHGHAAWLACHPRSETWRRGGLLGARLVPLNFRRRWRQDVALRLLAFCWRHRIDVVHCHGSYDSGMAVLAFACRVPVVRSRHVSNRMRSARSYVHLASHVIASGETTREQLVRAGVAPGRVTVIGEGVDLAEFRPDLPAAALRTELRLDSGDPVVLNVGMLRRDKGQSVLVEACARLLGEFPRLRVLVAGAPAGDPTVAGELRERIVALGLEAHVRLLGYRDDVAALMSLAQVVAVSSIGTEVQSRVVPQAFACRRAVVATTVGGLPERVRHEETGLLVPPSRPDLLALALGRLLRDAPLRARLAEAGHQHARRELSFDTFMEATLDQYRRLAR